MSSLVARRRTNDIVTGDQWLAFLASNSISPEVSEKIAQELTNAPETDDKEDCYYESNFRHCQSLVAKDRFAQLCIEAGINVPDEDYLRRMTFHKKLFRHCSTKKEAIERLQEIANLLNWQSGLVK